MRPADFTDEALSLAAQPPDQVKAPNVPIRIFKSAWLEAFTYSHPLAPLAVVPLALAAVDDAVALDFAPLCLFVSIGVLAWTLAEYAMHRFLFHLPVRTELGRALRFVAHMHHHAAPDDPRRVAATPIQIASMMSFFLGVTAPLPAAARGATLFGALLGYVIYEALHHAVHLGRAKWLRGLRAHHLRHHHGDASSRWGISSPLWDVIFRSIR